MATMQIKESTGEKLSAVAANCCNIPEHAVEDVHGVTPMQEALWTASTQGEGAYTYILELEARQGTVARLKAAWRQLVQVTPMLRSCLVLLGPPRTQLVQVVVRSEYVQEQSTGDTMTEAGSNLASLGLAQLSVKPSGQETPVDRYRRLSLRIHHALFDGWAMKLVLHGLKTCYLGESIDPWPPFRRYIDYLDETVTTCAMQDKARRFWHTRLSGSTPTRIVDLAAADDKPMTNAKLSFLSDLPYVTSSNRGQSGMITAAAVVQTAWAILAGAYAGTDDVLFATIVSGRTSPVPGILIMPGPTMAAVPSRVRLDRAESICELLHRVAQDAQAAAPHQHAGLARICSEYAGLEDGGGLPSLLVVQPPDVDVVGFGVGPSPTTVNQNDAGDIMEWRVAAQVDDVHPYPVVVECWMPRGRTPGPLRLTSYYDSRLFSMEQVRHLLEQFSDLIVRINAYLEVRPSERVGDLEVASLGDLELVQQLNSTVHLPVNCRLHNLFADSVRSNSEALALDGWDMKLTYGQVDELSDRVAQSLISHGVEAEKKVLTFFPKSAWAVVSLLGVSKLGGAFVPLEPAHPDRRLQSVAQLSGARVAVAHSSLAQRLRDLLGPEVDVLDTQDLIQTQVPCRKTSSLSLGSESGTPSSLAYIMFTSGTTGVPKGVQIEHASVCSSITARSGPDAMHMTPYSRVLHFSPYCFDAFIDEVFMTLSCGACICIAQQEELRDDLCGVINRYGITWAMLTPSVARILDPESVPMLQTLTLIGEAALPSDIAQWKSAVTRLLNGYGPTECSVICVVGDLLKDEAHPQTMSHYLGTTRGCCGWVVDPRDPNHLSPIGAVGELLIDGPNLGRGYLDSPEATATAWINTPSSWTGTLVKCERRVYRTGDLVRMRPDGSLLYIGRRDKGAQAKIRGQRFEPAELENYVRSALPDVRQVAAIPFLRNGSLADQELALAFVCDAASRDTAERVEPKARNGTKQSHNSGILLLSGALRDRLTPVRDALTAAFPLYMVPKFWVPMDEMPLMPSTKTDRQLLAQLLEGFPCEELAQYFALDQTSSTYRAPTDPVEQELVRIWASVLGMEPKRVSVVDDFLSIGGDSIKAMRLAGSCRSVGLGNISTMAILRLRTIKALAREADTLNWKTRRRGAGDRQTPTKAPAAFSLANDEDPTLSRILSDAAAILEVDETFIQDIYPATPLQSELFAFGLLNTNAYRGLFVFDLPLHIDPAALASAWTALETATPAVRTRMFRRQSQIWQAVIQSDVTPCPIVSMSLETHLYQARRTSSEMTFGSRLFTAHIVLDRDQEKQRNCLVLNVHHAVYDGWSIRTLMKELERAYHDSAIVSREFVERNVYSRFVDYIVHMDPDVSRGFWHEYLAGSTFSEFPEVKAPQSKLQPLSDSAVEVTFPLPESSFTASALVYASWAQLAAVYSGSGDVVFGTIKHGRDIPAVPHSGDIVGPMIASLPLRIRVPSTDSGVSIHAFLQAVEDASAATTEFEHYGLDRIRKSSPEAGAACAFHSLVIVQAPVRSRKESIHHGGPLGSTEVDYGSNKHPFPLVLEATPMPGVRKLHVSAHYDSSLMDVKTIQRLLDQLGHLVQEVSRLSNRSDATLADLNLLSPADASRIGKWNASSALPQLIESCVHDVVNTRVETQPHAMAVCGWDASFTYAQLHSVSSHLADYLAGRGIRHGEFVPICLEKSAWAAICQLAVLQAGGVCVMIDPKGPKVRNKDIINQCKAKFVLVSGTTKQLFHGSEVNTIVAPDLAESNGNGVVERPSLPAAAGHLRLVSPHDPAYCVFTSGSTGSPKGIIIEHAALCTSALNYGAAMGLSPSSRVLQFASYTFDVSVGEVLTTLIHGGCVCVPREEDRMSDLAGCINHFDINWLYLTSSVASLLRPEDVPCLETLVVGGEAVQQHVIEIWAGSHVTLINAYGPAETTIYCSSHMVPDKATDARNIGKAIGCRMWIVCAQDHQKLAPVGATGEILIDGPILAHSYLGLPEQTAAQFTTVSFLPGQRAYRSGDLACYDAQGNIHFRGRRDTQIKVNGQRIDVAEVETNILQSLHGIKQAAVVAFDRKLHGRGITIELAAFVIFGDTATVQDHNMHAPSSMTSAPANKQVMEYDIQSTMFKIRNHLRNVLPRHMVPSVYIPVPSLPRTTSLKLDRKALRRTVEDLSEVELRNLSLPMSCTSGASNVVTASGTYRPPRNDAEAEVLRLFRQVLGCHEQQISTDESFFDLGGNSLLAMQLLWLARNRGLGLTIADLYGNPSVSALAQYVSGSQDARSAFPNPVSEKAPEPFSLMSSHEREAVIQGVRDLGISLHDIEDIYPATTTQVGLLLQTEKQAGLWIAQDRWELPDELDAARFRSAWETVVERTPILRTRIVQVPVGPESKAYQVVVAPSRDGGSQIWETNEHNDDYGSQLVMGFGTDLSRYRLLEADGTKLFEWTQHHAVYDSWSTQLILRQLTHICRGDTSSLETLPFACYVRFLQEFDEKIAQEFWQSELADIGSEALSTCSFPRRQHEVASATLSTPATSNCLKKLSSLPTTTKSKSLCPVSDITTILEAAWALVIAAYTGSQDVVIGLVRSGRTGTVHPSLVNVVGPTINLLPRRFFINDQLSIGAFLTEWRKRAQAAAPYELAGYEVMRRMLPRGYASFNNLLVIQAGGLGPGEAEYPTAVAGLRPVAAESNASTIGAVRYPYGLVLECVPQTSRGGQGLELLAHYDSAQIEGGMVYRLLDHFEHVVEQLLQQSSETLLGNVSIMTPAQFRAQMPFLYDNPPPAAMELCAHDLIARNWHAGSHNADRPAVCSTQKGSLQHLTYRDLDKLSSLLCSLLIQQEPRLVDCGCEDHRFVVICLEKSIWTVVAMLAVWRAGGATILLDPNEPQHRLHGIARRAKALLVLVSPTTHHIWEHGLEDDESVHTRAVLVRFPSNLLVSDNIALEPGENWHGSSTSTTAPVPRTARPEDACYCVFTSGSTAEPKGVVIQHRAICTSASHHGRATGLSTESRVLQFASYSFDVAIDEMLTTLAFGGCVCVADEHDRRARLAGAIVEMRANVALLTPGVLQTLEPGSVPCLETVVVGGSALSSSLRALWEDRVHLLVAYGPSECSVTATMTRAAANSKRGTTTPGGIGSPVGCRAWVLSHSSGGGSCDDHGPRGGLLRLAPLGVVGELAIEGPILAEGYLDDKERTDDRFILASSLAAGFCKTTGCPPSSRIYRTGDLAMQDTDGSLLFIGRRDNQVKVRGVRVELEAIEHCILQSHDSGSPATIQNAVVVLPKQGPLASRLVAVLQPRDDEASTRSDSAICALDQDIIKLVPDMQDAFVEDVKRRIEEQLPTSHVPTAWAITSRMPLMPSGKVNRVEISQELENVVTQDFCVSPPGSLSNGTSDQTVFEASPAYFEAKIRLLMGQVLGSDLSLAPSGASFARFGGDSLMAMQLAVRCRAAKIPISLSMLLGNNSIAALAAAAAKREAHKPTTGSSASQGSQPNAPLVQGRVGLTPAQRMFFGFYPFGPSYFNQSMAMRVQHPIVTFEDIRRHLLRLVEQHPALRSRFWRRPAIGGHGDWHWESVVTDDVAGSLRIGIHELPLERKSGGVQDVDNLKSIAHIAAETQQSLNISSGPLLAADVFVLPDGSMELLLVAHHLVVDIMSWSILLGDLESLLLGAKLGLPAPGPPPVSLSTPPLGQDDQSIDDTFTGIEKAALDFWGFGDLSHTKGTMSSSVSRPSRFSISLGHDQTHSLSEAVTAIDQLEMGDIVEAVLVAVFTDFCCKKGRATRPAIYVEDHGRHIAGGCQGDLSTRVGWLTKVWPCLPLESTHLPSTTSLLEAIWFARHRRISSRSISQTRTTPKLPLELILNYTGRPLVGSSKGPLMTASESTTSALATVPDTDPSLSPMALIEVLASLGDEGLDLTVICDARLQQHGMVRKCIESCIRRLQDEAAPNLAASGTWRTQLYPVPALDTAQYTTSQQRRVRLLQSLGVESLEDVENISACSSEQLRILLVQARDPRSYHQLGVWQVSVADGSTDHHRPLDLDRLRDACRTVVQHHPALRTIFVQLPDMIHPVQVVRRKIDAERVLRAVPIEGCGKASTTTVRLELDFDHACFDGASTANLLRDIASAYSGWSLSTDSASVLQVPVDAIQQLRTPDDDGSFWSEHLKDVEICHLPPLGTAVTNPAHNTSNGEIRPVLGFFETRLEHDISTWSRQFGATAAVAIHLAWAFALSCYTGSQDVCFGWMVAGRDAPVAGIDEAIGMFARLLVCRARTDMGISLNEAVTAMIETMAQELEHQYSDPSLLRHGQALFDTLVSVQPAVAMGSGGLHGLHFHHVSEPDRTKFALVLNCAVDKNNIECKISYDGVRISETASRAFFATFEQSLAGIINMTPNSKETVADLKLSHPLHKRIANKFNALEPIFSGNNGDDDIISGDARRLTVPSLFDEQLHARPRAVAVDAWDACFTFAELDQLSWSLCRHLTSIGLCQGQVVPFLCDKSAWVVVGLLAVSRAGAACAFLSPADGILRLRQIVTETIGAAMIVTSPQHSDKAKSLGFSCEKIVALAPGPGMFGDLPLAGRGKGSHCMERRSKDRSRPDDVAFVVFTSGSTGQPKGIRLTHSAFCFSVLNYTLRLDISNKSRIFQFSAYTFDVGIGDMVVGLTSGATLCIPSEQDRVSDLNAVIERFSADVTHVTPSVAAFLRPSRCASLRTLALIGEAPTAELYRTWHGRVRLFNTWGPAECSVLASIHEITSPHENPSLIGAPASCRLWLVDPTTPSRLVPVGSVGEVLIEGPIVASGYLKNPDKTRQVFISSGEAPVETEPHLPSCRWYLTGDLARHVPGRGLVFIGRKDLQVKLRGQRIEIGEIEFHVRRRLYEKLRVAGVLGDREVLVAVVVAKQPSGEDSLEAFMALDGKTPCENGPVEVCDLEHVVGAQIGNAQQFLADLAHQLRKDLPPYMIPSHYLPVMSLPRMPSGKLDRARLRYVANEWVRSCIQEKAAASTHIYDENGHVTASERVNGLLDDASQTHLRALWAEVLKVEETSIGPEDNFFTLGGDSILAMRLAAAAFDEGTPLSVLTIMRFPELGAMATKLLPGAERNENGKITSPSSYPVISEAMNGTAVTSARVQPEPGALEVFPATNIQEAMVSFNMMPKRGFLNYFILHLRSRIDTSRIESACHALMARHAVLRSSFAYQDGRLYQLIHSAKDVAASAVRRCEVPEEEYLDDCVARIIDADRDTPLGWGDYLTKFFVVQQHPTTTTTTANTDSNDSITRLIIRLSHAVYDGMCLPTIWSDLSTAYDDEGLLRPPPASPDASFSHFARSVADLSQPTRHFWRNLLHESHLAAALRLPHHNGCKSLPPPRPALHKQWPEGVMEGQTVATVPCSYFALPRVTPASVLKAAWAITMAAAAALDDPHPASTPPDVVFGHIVSGREMLPTSGMLRDDDDMVVGAFLNCIPVRVALAPDEPAQDLACQVHAQHVAGLPHHSAGLQQLAEAGCMGPDDGGNSKGKSGGTAAAATKKNEKQPPARFSTVVQYQNLPGLARGGLLGITSGPLAGTRIDVVGRSGAYSDIWVTASPVDAVSTELEVRYDEFVVDRKCAHGFLKVLCEVLRSMHCEEGRVMVRELVEMASKVLRGFT